MTNITLTDNDGAMVTYQFSQILSITPMGGGVYIVYKPESSRYTAPAGRMFPATESNLATAASVTHCLNDIEAEYWNS